MDRDVIDALHGATVFVTGATGMLGYAVARALVDAGAIVRALSRSGALPGGLSAMRGVSIVRGDLFDREALARGLDGARFAFHVAADVRMWRGAWAEVHRTNVEGSRLVAEAARAAKVSRLVHTSSASTLGKPYLPGMERPPGVVTIDEENAYNLAPLGMVYPHTKWLSEGEVLRAADHGLDVVITHPAAIFGPWDFKGNFLPLFRAVKSPLGLAVPEGYRTICDVRDVAYAHLAAAIKGRSKERYALGGEPMSVKTLFGEIARAVGGRSPLFTLPAGATIAVGRALDAIAVLRDKAPLLSEEMAIQSTFMVEVSSDKAARELGYRSRPAREAITDMAAWYREEGLLR